MTTVERCRECGKLFPFLPRGVCRDCLEAREEAFRRVRDVFRGNPRHSVAEVAEATGVPVQTIMEWIAEGRLQGSRAAITPTEEEAREQERLEKIRRALAETVATTPPPAPAGPDPVRGRAPGAQRGMHGRHH